MKKVLIISNTSRSVYNYRRWLISDLLKIGYEVTVACNFDDYIEDLRKINVAIVELKFSRRDMSFIELAKAVASIRKLLLQENWYFIQTTTIKPNIYTALASIGTKVNYFSMVTGLGAAMTEKHQRLKFNFYKFLFKIISVRSTRVFVQGQSNTQFLLDSGYVPEKKLVTINGSGVDLNYFYKSEFPSVENEIRLIYAGRLLKSKGLPDIVALVGEANSIGYKCSLRIFGRLEQASPDSISMEELEVYGYQPGVSVEEEVKDIRQFLEEAHCLVLLTRYGEGIPKSLLEAGSMQRVVLVADAGASMELIEHEYNGYVLKNRNGAYSINDFCSFLSSYEQFSQVARNARANVEQSYSCTAVNDIILHEYQIL